jgi:anthranilate phosphoribosyltransferase
MMSTQILQDATEQLTQSAGLTADMMQRCVEHVVSGTAMAEDVRDFLLGLASRPYTTDELLGGVRALRAHMVPFPVDASILQHAVDTCGTGGDGHDTINISTIAAFIVAAAGVPVIKHGNRAASSQCGSADVLQALGIHISATPDEAAACLQRTHFTFLCAPTYHPAMKHVGPVRRKLGVRTIFNLLGPLASPAQIRHQIVGVSDASHAPLMAGALQALGCMHGAVVSGADGLDELSLAGPNAVTEVRQGQALPTSTVDAEELLGLRHAPVSALAGGDATVNAAAVRELLKPHSGDAVQAQRDVVLLNAAYAIYVSDMYGDSVAQCYEVARMALESGAAQQKLRDVQQPLPVKA